MRYGSACSGIEAASAAWHHLGWQPVFFSEIEPFLRAALAARWPGVPIHGDFTTIEKDTYEPIDLLVCGTPCQDFSVAGLRAGLAGERGFLTIEFVRLAERLRPRWLVWENVPGVLSSDDGRAFGLFLGALGECGYGIAYRVLDAQHFGVPQRRRRVFLVGYLGDWRPAAAVLFERESLRGDTAPRRAEGKRTPGGAEGSPDLCVAAPLGAGDGPRGWRNDLDQGAFIPIANPLGAKADCGWRGDLDNDTFVTGHFEQNSMGGRGTLGWNDGEQPLRPVKPQGDHQMIVTHSLRAEGFDASEDGTGRGVPLIPVQCNGGNVGTDLPSLRAGNGHLTGGGPAIAFDTYNQTTSETVQTLRDPNGTFGDALPAVAVPIQSVQSVREKKQNGIGIGADGDEMFTLTGRDQHAVAYGIRSDAARGGAAKTPSPDAEGRVRLRDPGMGVYEDLAPTVDAGLPHAVAFDARQSDVLQYGDGTGPLDTDGHSIAVAFDTTQITSKLNRSHPKAGDPCHPLAVGQHPPAVAYGISSDCIDRSGEGDGSAAERAGLGIVADASPSIRARPNNGVAQAMSVRRLTPVECARLQGFPDDYLDITYRGKPAADGPKYRALGNSMAVPCMRWIGERIAMVEELL